MAVSPEAVRFESSAQFSHRLNPVAEASRSRDEFKRIGLADEDLFRLDRVGALDALR
jgi:hypothetical protein